MFKWTAEAIQLVKDQYNVIGPVKLAKLLGTTLASVSVKAKRLGVRKKSQKKNYEWTEEMLATLYRVYPTADRETLARVFEGVPLYILRHKARKLGIRNNLGNKFAGRTRAITNTSCDIHYFDQWNPGMAWTLGFIFADGNISKRLGDVNIGLAATDVCVLEHIKKETKSTRHFYYMERWTDDNGHTHNDSVYLVLASQMMVKRLMELGVKPRKSFIDEPFPEVPVDMLPHFIRGYFDGDGSAYMSKQDGTFHVSFVGSPKFITGIRDSLEIHAGMRSATVVITCPDKTEHGRVIWSAEEDLCKFYNYIYPDGYSFCLERKRKLQEEWLNRPMANVAQRWTEEDTQKVKDLYRVLGSEELAARLGRSRRSVYGKARDLGIV